MRLCKENFNSNCQTSAYKEYVEKLTEMQNSIDKALKNK